MNHGGRHEIRIGFNLNSSPFLFEQVPRIPKQYPREHTHIIEKGLK